MNVITNLLTIQNQLRIFHWQTTSYAQHMAFGTIYDDLDDLIDNFVEIYQGKNGTIRAKNAFSMKLENLEGTPDAAIDAWIAWLTDGVSAGLDAAKDTDLLNIRDEMLGLLNKLKYLLTLS